MASLNRQRLLVDTDAYCKLGVAGLLTDALATLGVQIQECGRLAALPYMLGSGGLRRRLGSRPSDALVGSARQMPHAMQPSASWLDPLVAVASIDPGEAQLLAATAEHGLLLLTGDKRCLVGVKDVPGYAEALEGKVVVLEAILTELCARRSVDEIRSHIQPLMDMDKAIETSFSGRYPTPLEGLRSYYRDLALEVEPMTLWRPPSL